jgi:tetratricopeptide (TPR) repeat protein
MPSVILIFLPVSRKLKLLGNSGCAVIDLEVVGSHLHLDSDLEVGKLYFDRGDFTVAIEKLKKASAGFKLSQNYAKYLQCQNMLLRIYAERGDSELINQAKEELQDLVLKEGFELSAKTYYTLALCASYKGQQDTALDYLQKSLAIALASDNKEDICYAIFGIATVYFQQDRLSDSLKEIYNLQVFFQVLALPELKLSAQILNAKILRKMKKFDQALEVLWLCYDELKVTKNIYMYAHLLFTMGLTYFEAGDKDMAKLYLNLASKSVDHENMQYLGKVINDYLGKVGGDTSSAYDLVFDAANNAVTERKLGKIDFKNQFILLDLLRLFVQGQGQIYSKEYLVEHVWKQEYDPAVHDNKIYVTIKRLRKLIEPDYDKPKYIFRARNGYYMNKSARILVDQ